MARGAEVSEHGHQQAGQGDDEARPDDDHLQARVVRQEHYRRRLCVLPAGGSTQ